MTRFDHERLDAYQVAIEFVALANDLVEHLPRGRRHTRGPTSARIALRASQLGRRRRRVQCEGQEAVLPNGASILD